MGIFDFLKRKPNALLPEARWLVEVTADGISTTDHAGHTKSIEKEALSGVIIETNDSGPWGADVWWLMFDQSDELACAFPQGASDEKTAIDYFMKLEGFDLEAMIAAMSSTENVAFPVWRRSAQ